MTFSNLDKSQQPQLLCDFLMELGACSTSITDADRDTPHEQALFAEPGDDPWEMFQQSSNSNNHEDEAAVICGDAAVGRNVWNKCHVQAHFPASADLELIKELVEDSMDIRLSYSVEQVPNRDWVVHVQQSWKPILVSGIILRFPWHTDQDVQEVIDAAGTPVGDGDNEVVELQLEGGAAFGTGEHPTTQLCLGWIQETLRTLQPSPESPLQFLDYGSGSGVLGIAACAVSHHTVEAVGVDIDVDAVRIANANARTNRASMRNYLPPLEDARDDESKSVLMRAHHHQQEHTDEILPSNCNRPIYDACVANILAGPLVTLAPTLAGLTKAGGKLGLSGILLPQAETVVEAYQEFFENVVVENELNGWVLITGTRKS